MPQIIEYKTEAEWLKLRESDVTSSDVAALFGESPYTTEFELYHRKKNGLALAWEDNDRAKWGRRSGLMWIVISAKSAMSPTTSCKIARP